jgi:hypothetical protein
VPQSSPQKDVKQSSVLKSGAKPAQNASEPVWESMLQQMRTQNMPVYVLAKAAQSIGRNGNTIIVAFPPNKEPNVTALNVPKNLDYLKGLLKSIDESLQLHVTVQVQQSDDPQIQDMMRMFGNKLSIENGN